MRAARFATSCALAFVVGCATTAPGAKPSAAASDARVLFVVGMQDEADIAAGDGVDVIKSGADAATLRAQLATVDASRYRAVVSFG
ncbi:MAG TPA: hypothetical protein VGO62_00255, partial [Myxococcota bacterium]